MQGIELISGVLVFLPVLVAGMVAHELVHALVLHAFGIPYDIEWFPQSDHTTVLNVGVFSAWATVTPRSIPRSVPSWGLQLSAIAPVVLAAPFALVLVGIVPDPIDGGSALHAAVTVAWLGCALPSPQDFSLFFHADRVLDKRGE